MLEAGQEAPDFTLLDQDGRQVDLASLRGETVVLYFYPRADTPGCTTQACGLRDSWPTFEGKAEIFGVSVDSEKSHQKFIAKYKLPFPFLADPEKKIVSDYGVWGEKSMYGKKYMGTNRKTFLIDEKGKIAKIFDKVDVAAHADEVLAAFGEK